MGAHSAAAPRRLCPAGGRPLPRTCRRRQRGRGAAARRWTTARVDSRCTSCSISWRCPGHSRRGGRRGSRAASGKRVGVARALAVDPPILLMDEPFGALDPPHAWRSCIASFRRIQDRLRKTVIIATHDMGEASRSAIASACCRGHLIACDRPERSRGRTDPRVRQLLDACRWCHDDRTGPRKTRKHKGLLCGPLRALRSEVSMSRSRVLAVTNRVELATAPRPHVLLVSWIRRSLPSRSACRSASSPPPSAPRRAAMCGLPASCRPCRAAMFGFLLPVPFIGGVGARARSDASSRR